MKTAAFCDPEITRFNAELNADWSQHPDISDVPLSEARAIAEKVRARWARGGPQMASVHDHTIELSTGALSIRVYHPATTEGLSPALIYLHGGGFVMFSINTHDRLMREYADKGQFTVIGVDYALAPEHKYPAALNQITEFVLWLEANAATLGVDPERLAIGGDSAGGNLAISTCLRLRDASKLHVIKAVLANYGGFSAICSDQAEAERGGPGSVLNREEVEYFWRQYLNNDDERYDAYACPIHADLSGLPPVFLVIPDRDIVSEHSLEMAQRLTSAGVITQSKAYRGATHSFLEAMSISSLAREAIVDGADFLARTLAHAST